MNRLLLVGAIALSLLLVFQLQGTSDSQRSEMPVRLLSGDLLQEVAGSDFSAEVGEGCAAVYFMNPSCRGCRQLVHLLRMGGRDTDVWIVEGNASRARAAMLDIAENAEEHLVT